MGKPNVLLNKSFVVGDGISVKELLPILKKMLHQSKDDETLITISENSYTVEPLTTIIKCSHCDAIHFESCFHTDTVLGTEDIVYEDKSNEANEDDCFINLKQLIVTLGDKNINQDAKIVLSNSEGNGASPLTLVYRCGSECSAVHLVSGNEKESFLKN